MYKTFLKIFASNTLTNTDIQGEVNNQIENLDDIKNVNIDGKDYGLELKDQITEDSTIKNKTLLKILSTKPKAALTYINKGSDKAQRLQQIKEANPDFENTIMSDWRTALYYFHNILDDNDDSVEKELVKKIVDNNWVGLIPVITDMTKRVYPELQDMLTEHINAEHFTDELKSGNVYARIFKHLLKVLVNNGLDKGDFTVPFQTILKKYREHLDKNPEDQKEFDETINDPEIIQTESPRFGVDLTNDSSNATKIYRGLNNITTVDFGRELDTYTVDELLDSFKYTDAAQKKLKQVLNTITPNMISDLNEEFAELVNTLMREFKRTSSYKNRSKRMIKAGTVKAYTNYYIKNYLSGLLKQASPDMLPQVINTGVQEVQNMMYGDGAIQDFNNPVITKQISDDISKAVKDPDLIPGGAADGLTIESIAQKWSPIYNIPVEQLIPILEKQVEAGMVVESEHTNNPAMAREIAMDHLTEAADYYSYLENMEQLFPADNVAVKPLAEPENFEPEFLDNPDKKDHVCDGSCGGACQCHHEEIVKPQTVEDKIESLNDGMTVFVVSDNVPTMVEPGYDEVFAHIDNLAKVLKR